VIQRVSQVKAGGAETRKQVEGGPGCEKEADEDAALKRQGGAEGEQLEEEEGEPMEGLEEERPAEMEGVQGEKSAGSQRVEERERQEKERVKKEKKDKKKKDKKKKKGQKKEGERSRSGKSPLGEGMAKNGGPDVPMKMALEIPDPLVQANVARTLRLTRGKADSKDSNFTTEDEEAKEDEDEDEEVKDKAKNGEGLRRSVPRKRKKVTDISLEGVHGPDRRRVSQRVPRALNNPRQEHRLQNLPGRRRPSWRRELGENRVTIERSRG
jgi:hypothetical protein